MYIALSIFLAGMGLGRLFRAWLSEALLKRLTMLSIYLLLFLLGLNLGANDRLIADLPVTGLNALLLMLFCVAGSIACSALISPFLLKKAEKSLKK